MATGGTIAVAVGLIMIFVATKIPGKVGELLSTLGQIATGVGFLCVIAALALR